MSTPRNVENLSLQSIVLYANSVSDFHIHKLASTRIASSAPIAHRKTRLAYYKGRRRVGRIPPTQAYDISNSDCEAPGNQHRRNEEVIVTQDDVQIVVGG